MLAVVRPARATPAQGSSGGTVGNVDDRPELTLRIIIEGVVITLLFWVVLFLIFQDLLWELLSYTP